MSRWFAALRPVSVDVACGGERHRVSWRRGKVVLHDHVLRDEAVIAALGGEPPPCVAILDAWRDRAGWERANRPQPPGFVRHLPPPDVPAELAEVRRLGAVRAWERRWLRGTDPVVVEDLYRVLRERARRPLGLHLEQVRREVRGGPISYVEVRMTERDERPRVDGRIDPVKSYLVAWLPPRWLYRVRAHDGDAGGAGGAFVLDADAVVRWREISERVWKAEVVQPS